VRSFKKVMSIFLVSVMLLSMLPLNSLAQASNLSLSDAAMSDKDGPVSTSNSLEQGSSNLDTSDPAVSETDNSETTVNSLSLGESNPNAREQLIAALAEQYGSENSEAMFDSMVSMGIVDENGNRLTYKIEMDGKLYTLDQMREIVNAPGVDLTKEVKVDDKVVTLAIISKLIDFDVYLKFVEDNFLKNQVTVSDEHLKMLADLESQLNTEGISLMEGTLEAAIAPEAVLSKRSIPAPVPVAKVEYTIGAISRDTVDITYTLTEGGDDASVTFSQECLSGILDANDITTTSAAITLTSSSPTESVTLNLPSVENVLWKGEVPLCYVRLNDLRGGLFSNEKSSQLIPITMSRDYAFTSYKPTIVHFPFPINQDVIGPNAVNMLTNPWPKIDTSGWYTTGYWQKGDYDGELKIAHGEYLLASQRISLPDDARNLVANGNLTASASVFSWAGAGRQMDTYVKIIGYDKDNKVLGVPATDSYQGGDNTTVRSISGYILPAGTASVCFEASNWTNSGVTGPSMHDFHLHLTDYKAPTVEGINSPDETFKAGEQVPIVVTFSEPVVQNSALTLTLKDANDKVYTVTKENTGVTSSKITFIFDIPPQTPITLWPVSISAGVKDTSDNLSKPYNFPINGDTGKTTPLATTFAYNELDSMLSLILKHADGTELNGAYLPDETKGQLEIELFQSEEETIDDSTVGAKQNEWLINHTTVDPEDGQKFTVDRLFASYDHGVTKIPLYITDATDELTAEFDLPPSGSVCKMRLFMATGELDEESKPIFRPILENGYSANFSIGALTLVDAKDMTINYPASYPSGKDKVLNLGDSETVRLTYTYSGDATYKSADDFKWISSDEKIATINASTGEITPVGVGKVTFNLVAMNGTNDGTKDVSIQSAEFTVQASLDKPSLAVSKFITTKKGLPAQVMWSTNVIYMNQQAEPSKDTTFIVELYKGSYPSIADLEGITPTYTAASEVNASYFTIPGEQLTQLSVGAEPAYTVKISTDNPNVSGERVASVGNIIVTSPPAKVIIDRPASYYILDTANQLTLNWQSMDVNTASGYDFEFEVTKNGASVTESQEPSGSYTLNLADVTGKLKDVYTVTAKIKNTGDEAYSYDSFVLNVYDAEAMKIWVDKQDPTSTITLDNSGRISAMTSAEIVALERNISLTNQLSINYGDYSYGSVSDQIEWKSSDPKVGSINYSQGGAYKNIEDYDSLSYMPTTNFILAGLKDGTTTIDATHKLSRMTDTLGVTVKTLKDKLYLFQAMPLALTEFSYTNGDGTEKTISSDNQGAVAIYEPKGIKSDVKLKSIVGDSIYLGTIYHNNLLSGENDGSKGQLYPINNFVLRKAAQLDLNFKNPDGTPYIGTVTLRGGVYKNGNYCETSEISDQADAWKRTITINPDNGAYRQVFDITRFWSAAGGENSTSSVKASDEIDYVFEFHFGNDDYQPQISKFSGNLSGADVLRFGESVVNLVSIAAEDKDKPFFAAQYLDRYKKSGRLDNIKNATGNLGLNAQTPKVRIDTQALWWGEPLENNQVSVSLINEKGSVLAEQNFKTFQYPFATMLVTEHQVVIDQSNIWVDEKGRGKLTVKLFNEDGTLYNSTLQPYSIRNMLNVENLSQSQDVNQTFQEQLQKSIKAGSSFDAKDKFTQSALDYASNIKFGNDNFSLMLAPTSDPTVFNGLLQLNAGDDVMDMGPEEDEFSLMLDDDEVDSAVKSGYAKAREMANNLKDDLESLQEDAQDSSGSYQIGGYFSCQVRYNFETAKWEIRPIGGGIKAGIGFTYSTTKNVLIGGVVPATFELALGAAVRLEFDAHMLYEPVSFGGIDYSWQADKENVTDYLTNLRIKAYIYAFGGLGFDATIVALKIGVFGQLTLENENKFLNRNYLDAAIADLPAGYNQTEKALSGSRLNLQGQIGIKFVAKLLLISYKKTLASVSFEKEWTYRNWDKIEDYWKQTTGDMLTPENMSLATRIYAAATGQDLVVITKAPELESREYLKEYTRVWGSPSGMMRALSLDTENLAPNTLQTNAYPYANPLMASDGSMFVYLSDNNSSNVWDTTANYALKQGGSYVDLGKIDPSAESFGDSQMSFAGNGSLAISAWVRLADKLEKNSDEQLSTTDVAMMTNNTEIYTSIYKSGTWTTERLTSNSTPDMAPVVATNGSQAIVVWRSVYAGDAANPTDFSGKDTLVYRIYDGSSWSETKSLYNGVSGSVVGLEAAMMSDGTSAVAYIIDPSEERDVNSYEIVYGVLDEGGAAVKNVRLTNDDTPDENPQLTVAKIGDEERFMLGWYKMEGENSDIRLATFSEDGSSKEDFVDSLKAVSSGNTIGSNFKFVNTSAENNDFKNLSILWVEPNSQGSDSLKAIKFRQEPIDGTNLTLTSAAVDVAEMPEKTVIDSFDAYVSDAANDEVKVIILGTESKDGVFDTETDTDEDGNTVEIQVPKTESKMFTATQAYQNKAQITAAEFDYTGIKSGFGLPIAFTVQNQGKEVMTSVTLDYRDGDGTESKTFDQLTVLPGTSKTLIVNYSVPVNIADLSYSGTASFGDSPLILTGNGTLPLAVADVGFTKIDTVKEQDGQRQFAVSLYNSSDYKLKTSGKQVKLAIYDNSAYTSGTEVAPMVTISDPDQLSLIDNGAYTANLSFDLKSYLAGQGKDEIPANGVTLYAKAWIVDSSDKELPEFVGENNFSTLLCDNLVKRNGGNPMKVDVKQSNSETETTAVLTLQNLALKEVTNGNVAVNLLDEGGNIIETQYLSNTAEGLVTLGSEAVISKTFVFDTLGADVEAYYFNAAADSMNADLLVLGATGVGVNFDKDTTTYDNLSTNGLKSTNLTAISANPKAKVVLMDASNTVLAEETGAVAYTLPLATGSNIFEVTVEPDGAGALPKTYSLTVANAAPASGSVTLSASEPGPRGWWNISSVPVTLTATDLTNFTPTKMEYKVDNGDWTSKTYTSSPIDVTNITAEGTHFISVKLQNANDYNLATNSLTVKVDRTAPVFRADKTSAVLAGDTLTVSAEVTDALSGIYSVVMTSGGTTYSMQKQGDTDTYTANITANSVGAITIVATDLAGNTAQTSTGSSNSGGSSGGGGSHTPKPTNPTTPTSSTVTGSVIDGKTGAQVSNVAVTVTTDSEGNVTVSMGAVQVLILKQPDGTTSPLSDFSRVAITTATGSPATISADGTIQVQNLAKGTDNHFIIFYDLGNGQRITMGTMDINMDSKGNVQLTTTLIDPYGIITDSATGAVITGADVTLYYADTERNKAAGKIPNSLVELPIIEGFEPNDNKNPQISDLGGAYGFMVFPTSDYYIVATKDGYDQFRSPTIPVEQDIVKLDFKMNQPRVGVTRLAGLTKVDTALEIAKASYTGKISNVILATADNFPDALAGSVLGYKLNAPILLVGSSEEDHTKVITYLKDYMDPKGTVYILGGTAAVSDTVEEKIVTSGFFQIKRLGGFDQYETALKISDELDLLTGTPVVLAYGENYPDALSISSAAAAMQYPILLVGKDGISDGVKQKIAELKPIRAYIIGGQAVVGRAVEDQVSELTPLGKRAIVRLSGVDRYETSFAVANYFKLAGQTISVATGKNFPDALAGSAYAANFNAPIILVDDKLSETILKYLKTKEMTGATIFGGEFVISKAVEQQLGQLLGK